MMTSCPHPMWITDGRGAEWCGLCGALISEPQPVPCPMGCEEQVLWEDLPRHVHENHLEELEARTGYTVVIHENGTASMEKLS